MVLDSLDRKGLVTDAFDGAVIDASVGDFDAFRKVVIGDRIAMVLAGDIDAARAKILDRVVRSAVSKGQLEGVTTECCREHLDTKADAEDRFLSDELLDGLYDEWHILRVPWSRREEDAVRISCQQLFSFFIYQILSD